MDSVLEHVGAEEEFYFVPEEGEKIRSFCGKKCNKRGN